MKGVIVILGLLSAVTVVSAEQKPKSVHQEKNAQRELDLLRKKEREAKARLEQLERDLAEAAAREKALSDAQRGTTAPVQPAPQLSAAEQNLVRRINVIRYRIFEVRQPLFEGDAQWLSKALALASNGDPLHKKYQVSLSDLANRHKAMKAAKR